MADAITRNSTPAVPIANMLRAEWKGSHTVENILHPQLHGSGHNITYRPTRKRAGTLSLYFTTPAAAWAAVAVLIGGPYTFTLVADTPALSMTFVLRPGQLEPIWQKPHDAWVVDVPFQDVTP